MARTRFQRADQADSDCTPADGGNKPLLSAQTGGNETVTFEIPAQTMNDIIHSFTMASGDPGGAEDLGAASLFRMQLDITVIDATITCKIAFHGVNASCATQGNAGMDEGDFSAMGLNLGTTSWDPPISDRYQGRVLATNSEGHNGADGTLTLRTNNSNAFYEIPNAPTGADDEEAAARFYGPDQVHRPPPMNFTAVVNDGTFAELEPPDLGIPAQYPDLVPRRAATVNLAGMIPSCFEE